MPERQINQHGGGAGNLQDDVPEPHMTRVGVGQTVTSAVLMGNPNVRDDGGDLGLVREPALRRHGHKH